MRRRAILVVEDGTEYADAFRRLGGDSPEAEWLHAPDAGAAKEILGRRSVDAVFLDVVFDRTPPDRLVGDAGAETQRFGGDRARALEHLARNQGFYVLDALAPAIPRGTRVLIAHDFTSQPGRLEALREKVPALEGVAESSGIGEVLERLRAE